MWRCEIHTAISSSLPRGLLEPPLFPLFLPSSSFSPPFLFFTSSSLTWWGWNSASLSASHHDNSVHTSVEVSLAPFTQISRIIAAAVVLQFSIVGHSHRAKQCWHNGELLSPPCNVALWDFFLYLVEWGTCVVIRLSDRRTLDACSRLIHSHWFSSPILLQRWISAGAKFHPSPLPRHSYRGRGGELVQDPCIQTAVWMGLVWRKSCHSTAFRYLFTYIIHWQNTKSWS